MLRAFKATPFNFVFADFRFHGFPNPGVTVRERIQRAHYRDLPAAKPLQTLPTVKFMLPLISRLFVLRSRVFALMFTVFVNREGRIKVIHR